MLQLTSKVSWNFQVIIRCNMNGQPRLQRMPSGWLNVNAIKRFPFSLEVKKKKLYTVFILFCFKLTRAAWLNDLLLKAFGNSDKVSPWLNTLDRKFTDSINFTQRLLDPRSTMLWRLPRSSVSTVSLYAIYFSYHISLNIVCVYVLVQVNKYLCVFICHNYYPKLYSACWVKPQLLFLLLKFPFLHILSFPSTLFLLPTLPSKL